MTTPVFFRCEHLFSSSQYIGNKLASSLLCDSDGLIKGLAVNDLHCISSTVL